MDQWIKLRQQIHNDEVPLRQLERDTGIHRQTLRKIRDNSQPPGYQRTRPILKSKMAPYVDRIKAIIKADKDVPRKQRHTAKRIWEILQAEGFTGGYTNVLNAVELHLTNHIEDIAIQDLVDVGTILGIMKVN